MVRVRSLKVIQYLINYETEIIKENSELVLKSLLPLATSNHLQIRLTLLNVAQARFSKSRKILKTRGQPKTGTFDQSAARWQGSVWSTS